MTYTLSDIDDILFDGSKEAMDVIPDNVGGSVVSYAFHDHGERSTFELRLGKERIKACKVSPPPNCVKYFGNEHTF